VSAEKNTEIADPQISLLALKGSTGSIIRQGGSSLIPAGFYTAITKIAAGNDLNWSYSLSLHRDLPALGGGMVGHVQWTSIWMRPACFRYFAMNKVKDGVSMHSYLFQRSPQRQLTANGAMGIKVSNTTSISLKSKHPKLQVHNRSQGTWISISTCRQSRKHLTILWWVTFIASKL